MTLIKTTTQTGLPAFQEDYTYTDPKTKITKEGSRYYLATQHMTAENVNNVLITTYCNHKIEHKNADWVSKIIFIGLGSVCKTKHEHYFNYTPGITGFRRALSYSEANTEKFGDNTTEINKWFDETKKLFISKLNEYSVSGSQNRAKKPKHYTAGLRYGYGAKGYASNAASLIIVDEQNDKILLEVIRIGDITIEHTPTQDSTYNIEHKNIKQSNGKNAISKVRLKNGYSYTNVQLWKGECCDNDWGDELVDEPMISKCNAAQDALLIAGSTLEAKSDYSKTHHAMNDDYLDQLLGDVL
ncbi:TPA: hypothetical protein ACGUON_000721 [Vibrio vulnificus]|nr:hypothetical protein [Vibrio vulnificus]